MPSAVAARRAGHYSPGVFRRGRALVGLAVALAVAVPAAAQAPVPQAESYVLTNTRTGAVLAAENPSERLPMASTTKIMTALIAIEQSDPDDVVTVPAEAAIGGSTAGLVTGEQLRMDDLLTGVLVGSGNDAAITAAHAVAGSEPAFVDLMNRRAEALGLNDTRFANSHGLDAPDHYSSVRDLVRLGRVAMRQQRFRERVGARRAVIPGPDGVGTRTFESKNGLLDIFEAADGIKTGQTADAGFALVARADSPELGVTLGLALIGSPSEAVRAFDAKRLFEWGFRQYARPELLTDGAVIGAAGIRDRPGVSVPYRVEGAVRMPIRLDGPPINEVITAPAELRAPVNEGDVVGEIVLRQGERELARRDLVAAESAAEPGLWDRVRGVLGSLTP